MRDPLLFTPRILWFALLMSQVIYVVILTMPDVVPPPSEPPEAMFPLFFGALAAVVAVASFVVPTLLSRSATARADVEVVPQSIRGAAPSAYREPTAMASAFADPAGARKKAFAMAFAPFIVSLAMSEAISILGLVLGFLGHPPMAWAPFVASGMLLTAWRFPTEARFVGPLARAKGVTID